MIIAPIKRHLIFCSLKNNHPNITAITMLILFTEIMYATGAMLIATK